MALSPMLQTYMETKEAYKDCIVFYRLGDFYEMFFDDAILVSRELGLTLTGRDCGLEERAPMCGVPFHAASGYIKRLIDIGHRVAVCEQITRPTKGSKQPLVREVVKVVTPGTLIDDAFLSDTENNFIAAVSIGTRTGAITWCDVSTGEFNACEVKTAKIDDYLDILYMCNAREVICDEVFASAYAELNRMHNNIHSFNVNDFYTYAYDQNTAYDHILKYFGVTDTKVFDFEKSSPITKSTGALIEYLNFTIKKPLSSISRIVVKRDNEYMFIDKTARENLELTHLYREPKTRRGSLLSVLDNTCTPMGARLLASMISQPLQNLARINNRLDAVAQFVADTTTIKNLESSLKKVADLTRIAGKIASGTVSPRDLLALKRSLDELVDVKNMLLCFGDGLIKRSSDSIVLLDDLSNLIGRAVSDASEKQRADGGFIRTGYDKVLDDYRNAQALGLEWLADLEQKEREECKIKNLRIGFNKVAGYYFEVPKSLSDSVPYRFTRRATTASTERYVTTELKELEEKILNAEERAREQEQKLFAQLVEETEKFLASIQASGEAIAVIDVIRSLANVAITNNYVRPRINDEGRIVLKNARHATVERALGNNRFIANDCELEPSGSTMLITGPNMAGKSTYMRTVAICTIMAHVGSFVPCSSADIALTDRVFTRIGASDSLHTGQSTFMVEMTEVSNITHNATNRSLVLLDEVGRGTGTKDGLALASAIVSYITDRIGANTMFATHFHELTALAKVNPKIKNYKALTSQDGGEISFLHRIEPGIEHHSFGVDVAKMAGLPKEIIETAKKLYSAK